MGVVRWGWCVMCYDAVCYIVESEHMLLPVVVLRGAVCRVLLLVVVLFTLQEAAQGEKEIGKQ